MSTLKRKKKNNKNKKIKFSVENFIFLFLIVAALFFINTTQVRRKIIRIYNHYSVYLFDYKKDIVSETNHFDVDIPLGYTVHGVDVSRYQSKINWEKVAKIRKDTLGISFAFIKATQGKIYSDKFYEYNISEARKNGIICGAYHFYEPSVNSKQQAENFISLVHLKSGDLPPVLDIEIESPYGHENLKKGILNWLQIIENHYGVKPIIYTSNSFHKDFLSGKDFEDYPFWIAHYYKKEIKTSSKWIFWQHTDKARVNGISGYVDLSVFNGTKEDLKRICKPY